MNFLIFIHIQITRHLQNTTLYLFYGQDEYKFIPAETGLSQYSAIRVNIQKDTL